MTEYEKRLMAKEKAERALAKVPDDPERLLALANATAELGFYCGLDPEFSDKCAPLMDTAIDTYRALMGAQPENGALLTNLGAALSDRGRHSMAVKILRQAIVHNPKDRNAHFNLAVALMNIGAKGRREAQRHFNTASLLKGSAKTREAYFDPLAH